MRARISSIACLGSTLWAIWAVVHPPGGVQRVVDDVVGEQLVVADGRPHVVGLVDGGGEQADFPDGAGDARAADEVTHLGTGAG